MYTQVKPDLYQLSHHGVLGMKWGIRRYQPYPSGKKGRYTGVKEQRQKVSNILKNKDNINKKDLKRLKDHDKSSSYRLMKQAKNEVVKAVISEVISGNVSKYSTMDKTDLQVHLSSTAQKAASKTMSNYLRNEAIARSVASKYTQEGVKKDGKQHNSFTREDLIVVGEKAVRVAPLMRAALAFSAQNARDKRAANEAKVKSMKSLFSDPVIWLDPSEYSFK